MGQICLGSVKETECRDEPDAIVLKLNTNPHNSPTPHFCDDPGVLSDVLVRIFHRMGEDRAPKNAGHGPIQPCR
jgi:hypothetical protein